MKRLLSILTGVLLVISLGGCGSDTKDEQNIALKSGIELENMDTSVRPQDDFYNYVNGLWIERTVIDSDESYTASFSQVRDSVEESLKKIVQNVSQNTDALAGSNEKMIGDLYNSYMDMDTINTKGILPLQDGLDSIFLADTYEDITKLMAELYLKGTSIPLSLGVYSDDKNSTQYITYIGQSGLGLPGREYYSYDDEVYVSIRDKYKSYIASMMSLAGYENTQQIAIDILTLETQLSAIQWSREANEIPEDKYNKYTIDEVNILFDSFDIGAFLSVLGLNINEIIIEQPSYFQEFDKIFKETPISIWRDYLAYMYIDKFGWYLGNDFVDLEFDFFKKTLYGTQEQTSREERAITLINTVLGEILGELYIEKYFSSDAKVKVLEMTQNILNSFESSINELEWMGETTKRAAIVKLNKITTKIGYPDTWKDYTGLEIKADDLVGNIIRYNIWSAAKNNERLGTLVDNSEWFMTPQTVNAYYNPYANEIVFPSAILQPPFFDMNADDAVNYGAIGSIIGHELSHAFDDYGSKYDGDGNLKDWWQAFDKETFEALGKKLIERYDAYKPFEDDNITVNGTLTLGENIANLGGINVAYKAYINSLNGEVSTIIDGFTGEQRFFIGYTQSFRDKFRDEFLRNILLTNPHLPGLYCVNGVVIDMPEFYEAFDVKEGDEMYKVEEERVKIW